MQECFENVFFFSLEVCFRQVLQSSDIRVSIKSHHVTLIVIYHSSEGSPASLERLPGTYQELAKL